MSECGAGVHRMALRTAKCHPVHEQVRCLGQLLPQASRSTHAAATSERQLAR